MSPTPLAIATAEMIASVPLAKPASISPDSKSLAEFVMATPGRKIVTEPIITGPMKEVNPVKSRSKAIKVARAQLKKILIKLLNLSLSIIKESA